jgi:glycosyltransferase involved in cell wall biosynthesis
VVGASVTNTIIGPQPYTPGTIAVDILFIHQNMPAQFKHLAPALAADGRHRVVFITRRKGADLPGVRRVSYDGPRPAGPDTHHYVRLFEASVRYGQQVARAMTELKREGFVPAVVIGHPGWGEMLFVKEVFPRARVISYAEYYYSAHGGDVGFEPGSVVSLDTMCRTRARNAHLLLSLEMADAGLSPTEWQRSRHPAVLQPKIRTIFDGIDTDIVRPDPGARFALDDGRTLTRENEVLTYVTRNFEPYRGFPSFMRSLPAILSARPEAHVVITGGDEISYGQAPPDGRSWREVMLAEVPLDRPEFADRVHFTGRISYARYLSLLQISAVHIYLTIPFVLSWSCVEALACGAVVVASDTAPVREFIEHGDNGYLVDMLDPAAISRQTIAALATRGASMALRKTARDSVLERYALSKCLPRQLGLVQRVAEMN